MKNKHIIILLLSIVILNSCKTKTFNGTAKLDCPDHDQTEATLEEKSKTKWRLVLYKDGKKIGRKSKKGKSRLFKKKN